MYDWVRLFGVLVGAIVGLQKEIPEESFGFEMLYTSM